MEGEVCGRRLFYCKKIGYTFVLMQSAKRKKVWKNALISMVAMGLIATVMLVGVFFAVRWHWTDVPGTVDEHSGELQQLAAQITELRGGNASVLDQRNRCKAFLIGETAAVNARHIVDVYDRTKSGALLANMVEAASLRLSGDQQRRLATCDEGSGIDEVQVQKHWNRLAWNLFPWMNTEDWSVFKEATIKDRETIDRVSRETGVEPRMIVAQLVAEQLRLFNSDRAVYKRFFAPLKMLGSETKFSLGVTGIKEATAIRIENNAKDVRSPYYPGPQYEHLLDFKTADVETERYDRITNEHDHYYAYLYAALYLKEVAQQWKGAGYDISHRPEILSTLFNIGFDHSKPNANPGTGGAMIEIAGEKYSFGSLGYEFYYSGELMDEFSYGA